MNLALAYKRTINFQALIQLSLLFINTSSTSWMINFEDQETNTKNSTAIERNTSLKDLITFVESLKAENSIDIHSLELVTESRIQDLGKSEMVDTIKQSHLTVCPLSQSIEALVSYLDSYAAISNHNKSTKTGLVLYLKENRTELEQNLLFSKLFANPAAKSWTVTAVYYVNDLNIRRIVRMSAATGSYMFFVDLPGNTAARLMMEAYKFGLRRRFVENIWLLSAATTLEFPIWSNVPDSIVIGFKTKSEEGIYQKIQTKRCGLQTGRTVYVETVQLLNDPSYLTGKTWKTVGEWRNNTITTKISKLVSSAPILRIVTGDSYAPYVQIVATNENVKCGLNGIRGYRYENSTSDKTMDICAYGRDIDYIRYFEKELGFQAVFYVAQDGTWGKTGALGDVMIGKADFLVSSYTTKDLEFSFAHEGGMCIAYMQNSNFEGMGPGAPFHINVWLMLASTFVAAAVILWIIEISSPYGNFQKKLRPSENLKAFNLDDSLNYFWGLVVCGELIKKKPRSNGSHVMAVLFSCFGIGVVALYTANVISFLVTNVEEPPITGLSDPKLLRKTVRVASLKGAVLLEKLKSSSQEYQRQLHDALVFVESFEDGMNKLTPKIKKRLENCGKDT